MRAVRGREGEKQGRKLIERWWCFGHTGDG